MFFQRKIYDIFTGNKLYKSNSEKAVVAVNRVDKEIFIIDFIEDETISFSEVVHSKASQFFGSVLVAIRGFGAKMMEPLIKRQ